MTPFTTTQQLAEMLGKPGLVLLDTRFPHEFELGHIPGSVNLPEALTYFVDTSREGVAHFVDLFTETLSRAGLEAGKQAVVYQDELSGGFGQSARAWLLLNALGHRDTSLLLGGFEHWSKSGLPVTRTACVPVRARFQATVDDRSFVTLPQVVAALEEPSVVLLDVRDGDEWEGRVPSPGFVVDCPRCGRLPGARWIHWRDFLTRKDDVAVFKTPEEIRALCGRAGIHPSSDVIIYCLAGVRASNTYLALKHAGFDRVRVYLGSWYEWSRDPSLPNACGLTLESSQDMNAL